jgi:hypothetical protein
MLINKLHITLKNKFIYDFLTGIIGGRLIFELVRYMKTPQRTVTIYKFTGDNQFQNKIKLKEKIG